MATVGDLNVEMVGTGEVVEVFVDVAGEGVRSSWAGRWHDLRPSQRERLAVMHALHTRSEVAP